MVFFYIPPIGVNRNMPSGYITDHISSHFSLAELSRSALALRHGITNTPGAVEIGHLTRLAKNILEPVREHFRMPFSPSSAYRSPELNRLAGSRDTSQHMRGQAADFEIPSLANGDLAYWIRDNLTFDQLILEFYHAEVPKSGWVHCSYVAGLNRNQCLIFDGKNYQKF